MLTLTIPPIELYDDVSQEFLTFEGKTLELEHSLVSISKWEATWCKPFLLKENKTREETIDYIKCMTLTPNVSPDIYNYITDKHIELVNDYIQRPMTATWFTERKGGGASREQITSEIIYYWMIALSIPQEYQYWHLNRLITLIRICNIKNQPKKKMNSRDALMEQASINEARKKALNSKG